MHRSYLFVPGNRPNRFASAAASGADVVIIDLEDSVGPSEKAAARMAAAAWISPARPAMVRVNAAGTEWFRDDLVLCRQAGIAGVVLPKAQSADEVRVVADAIGPEVPVLPIIETALGVWSVEAIARAPKVTRLLFGSIDLKADLGISGEDRELLYVRSCLVLVSRVTRCQPPVDGVTTAINSRTRLRIDAKRARRLGFGGKLCIHPSQVGPVNECFQPSPAEVVWAQRVTTAAASAGASAFALDGEMVDEPVLARARAILLASGM